MTCREVSSKSRVRFSRLWNYPEDFYSNSRSNEILRMPLPPKDMEIVDETDFLRTH